MFDENTISRGMYSSKGRAGRFGSVRFGSGENRSCRIDGFNESVLDPRNEQTNEGNRRDRRGLNEKTLEFVGQVAAAIGGFGRRCERLASLPDATAAAGKVRR